MERWFSDNRIDMDDDVRGKLDEWGVECLEDLKIVPLDLWVCFFEKKLKMVPLERAKIALTELQKEKYKPEAEKSLPIKDTFQSDSDKNGESKKKEKNTASSKRPKENTLTPITNYYKPVHKKQKTTATASRAAKGADIDLTLTDNEENDSENEEVLVLPSSNWRLVRDLSSKLQDPPSILEKKAWYPLKEKGKKIEDYGDIYGYYKLIFDGADRTTSDIELKDKFEKVKKQYKSDALKFHPDKNPDVDETLFLGIQQAWEKVKQAYDVLGSVDNEGKHTMRYQYDLDCDNMRVIWKEKSGFSEEAATIRQERQAVYKKKKSTEATVKKMSPLETVWRLFNPKINEHQTNEWRFAVIGAFNVGSTAAEISRVIRIKHGASGWDGRAASDAYYQAIKSRVLRGLKKQLELTEQLSEAEKSEKKKMTFMKSKSVKLGSRGRQIIDDVATLEDELKQFITKLRRNKRRVTRTIIIRKAMDLKKDFLGGVGSKDFMRRMKDWYYYGLKKRLSLSL